MEKYAIILAGGMGKRLWPISTPTRPKQFLNCSSNKNMINETIERIESIFSLENIFIVIDKNQEELAKKYIDNRIKRENILLEPYAKNTSACIAYAAMKIKKEKYNSIMCVFSADHIIKDTKKFINIVNKAIDCAEEKDNLITIGIQPTYPATQYGYIKYSSEESEDHKVISFEEKPELERAQKYFESNQYLWNSGIFIWKNEIILEEYKKYLPQLYKEFQKLENNQNKEQEKFIIEEIYQKIDAISIDYGIMEKSDRVRVIKGDFDWEDIGKIDNFLNKYKESSKNIIQINSKNCVAYSSTGKKMILLDVDDLIVIENEELCFVAPKSRINDLEQIKEIYDKKTEGEEV